MEIIIKNLRKIPKQITKTCQTTNKQIQKWKSKQKNKKKPNEVIGEKINIINTYVQKRGLVKL